MFAQESGGSTSFSGAANVVQIKGFVALSDAFQHHDSGWGPWSSDGKEAAFNKVKQGLNAQGLSDTARNWTNINEFVSHIAGKLQDAADVAFAGWSGDDADSARTTFNRAIESANNLSYYSGQLASSTSGMAKSISEVTGEQLSSSDTTLQTVTHFADPITNFIPGFGGGDGSAYEAAYQKLVGKLATDRNQMPAVMTWQVKTDGAQGYLGGYTPPAGTGSGVSGVGGVGSGNLPTHQFSGTGSIPNPKDPPTTNLPGGPRDPIGTTPPGLGGYNPPVPSPVGGGGYIGTPTLDSGSQLAGYNPGMGGAGGGFGGGAGSGLAGGGLGSTGLAGGGLTGSGAGGLAGAGAAGAGSTAGGAGGAGAPGMMSPMRGGGAGNGDDERERSTWLSEDDDVWGADEAPPSVIS